MKRIFKYDGRKRKADFNVTTELSDETAINLLTDGAGIEPGNVADTFASKCAFEIHKVANGFRGRDNMVAWGFKLAEEKANPVAPLVLGDSVLSLVAFRRPLRGEVNGHPFKVSLCGERSRHCGKYAITDGKAFSESQFYGYAEPDGSWSPSRRTPEEVIAKLTE